MRIFKRFLTSLLTNAIPKVQIYFKTLLRRRDTGIKWKSLRDRRGSEYSHTVSSIAATSKMIDFTLQSTEVSI